MRGEGLETEEGQRAPQEVVVPPLVQHCESRRRVEVLVECVREALPGAVRRGLGGAAEHLAKSLCASSRCLQGLLRVLERLPPVPRQEEHEERLPTPAVERGLERDVVAHGLVHLLAREREHPVVHPELRERVPERARLGDLVLVVREHEVETSPVDLELRAQVLLGHDRALDVPAGASCPPGRVPGRVLSRLRRLPEREVARILLARVRLLLLDLVRPLAAQPPVVRVARNAEVDVPIGLVGEAATNELLDHRDLVADGLDGRRLDVRTAETEPVGVLDVPARCVRGEPRARAGRRVVDLVVDVGDVHDELRLVAPLP